MKITAKKGRYNKIHVHIDGEYLLTIDDNFWFSCGYVSGDEIDEEGLAVFKKTAGSRCVFNEALNCLDRREYSKKEMKSKLLRKYDEEPIDEAIEKLVELKLIDDERYAELLTRELFERKKYGINRIKTELYQKGIDREIINYTLDEFFENDETDNIKRIVDIIRKKYYNKVSDENGRRKVFNALVRLGYSFSDIREAMKAYSDDDFYEEF